MTNALAAAIEVIAKSDSEDMDKIKASALMLGYDARYHERYKAAKIIAVEQEFEFDLVNPETSGKSRSFKMGGKINVMIEERGQNKLVEHKTCSEQIEAGAKYWDRLAMDPQISAYFVGAETVLNFRPETIIYDAIRKPGIAQTQKETVADYAQRLQQDVINRAEFYYGYREVARRDEDLREYMGDVWAKGQMILHFRSHDIWPRNTAACTMYGTCPYFGLCAGYKSATDYVHKRRHEELETVHENGLQILTNSRLDTLQRCPRRHQLRYEAELVLPGDDAEALRFGSLMHEGLEAWFKCLQSEQAVAA